MILKIYSDERKTYLDEGFFLTPLFGDEAYKKYDFDSIFLFGGREGKRRLIHDPKFHSSSNLVRGRG